MSSSKRLVESQSEINRPADQASGVTRRTALGIGLAGLGSLVLSACGFHPMYGDPAATNSAGGATSAKLAQVKVNPIADRIGQQLNNLLRDRMNPAGQPDKPAYRLAVTLDQNDVLTVNGDSHVRHNELTVIATYWLSPADNDKSYLMDRTNSRVVISYDTLDDPYNDIATKEDAQSRAVDQLADMITTRIAAYFSHNAA